MSGFINPGELIALASGVGGAAAVLGGAFALGLRHGIDWDHIAAITDITSAPTSTMDSREAALTEEPAVVLTDEADSRYPAGPAEPPPAVRTVGLEEIRRQAAERAAARAAGADAPLAAASAAASVATSHPPPFAAAASRWMESKRNPVLLGTLYALGHATAVTVLGLIAILAAGFLPEWIDPIMGRVVGVTLLFLAAYLYYSIYRYFRGGRFRMVSRWMLVFDAVRTAGGWAIARVQGKYYHHTHREGQYGRGTAYTIGVIHGIGAETGTQVLLIATAVGAGSRAAGVAALLAFVVGLVISNSVVTLATAAGFVSASRRQWLYVAAGFLAATFSLVLGALFLFSADGLLPSFDPYLTWIGGPS